MLFKFKLNESLLNEDEQFYDYGTAQVSNDQIFDTTKTGMSYYNNFLNTKDYEYMRKSKNLEGKIVMMTPNEYFDACADIFNSSRDKQIKIAESDPDIIEHLVKVITEYKKRFPIGFINYAEKQQEGRHRMYTAGKLFGFDHKFPVLVIDWFDKDLQTRRENTSKLREEEDIIKRALSRALDYRYSSLNDFVSQIEIELERITDDYDLKYKNNVIEITLDNTYEVNIKDDIVTFEMDAHDTTFEDSIDFYEAVGADDLDDLDDLLMNMSDDELEDYAKKNFGFSLK